MYLILAESELEFVPKEIEKHPQVRGYARYTHKKPENTLLDSSLFFKAMKNLPDAERRGRPDLVHLALLLALDSPAARRKELEIFVHTRNDEVIHVNTETRLPKNYTRFVGLMEQLFATGRVPPKGPELLTLEKKTLKELINELRPDKTLVFDTGGEKVDVAKLKNKLTKNCALVVGGFPHGKFRQTGGLHAAETLSIGEFEFLAATVVGFITAAIG